MQWEYHEEIAPSGKQHGICTAAGKDGWQLCVAVPCQIGATEASVKLDHKGRLVRAGAAPAPTQGLLLMFKRPIPQEIGEEIHDATTVITGGT
jgi:hypothetical protein